MKKLFFKIITITLFLILTGCSTKEVVENTNTNVNTKYTVLRKDDISSGSMKTYIYTVIINEKLSKDNMEKISEEILEKAKQETPFNAIQIHLYDGEYSALAEVLPTLGKYTFAPSGDLSKAIDVETGEYDKMTKLSEFKNVNWNLKPSEKSIKVINMYNEVFSQELKSRADGIVKKEDIIKRTSELMSIDIEEVNKALEEFDNWVWQE